MHRFLLPVDIFFLEKTFQTLRLCHKKIPVVQPFHNSLMMPFERPVMHGCSSETTTIHQCVPFGVYCTAVCGRRRETWMKIRGLMMINGMLRSSMSLPVSTSLTVCVGGGVSIFMSQWLCQLLLGTQRKCWKQTLIFPASCKEHV